MDSNNASTIHPALRARETYETALSVLFLLVTMATAVIGNTAVIAVVCKQRSMRLDVSNLLIINLSITDLSNTLLVMMSSVVSLIMDSWPFGEFWCACTCTINYCLIIVSMLTLCCISIDRYQAVMHPLSYPIRITRRRLLGIIGYTWFQGTCFGLAPSLLSWVKYDYWEAICAIQWHLYRPSSIIYVVFAFVMCFLGPGAVLIYCYAIILKEVKKQKSQFVGPTVSDSKTFEKHKRRVSERAKITWSLLTVVLAYFVCTTPFSVTKLIKVSANNTNIVPGQVNLTASLLGYVASAINPLIYGIFRRDFRTAYIQLLKSLCGCREMRQLTNTTASDQNSHLTTNGISNCNQLTVGHDTINDLQNHLTQLSQMANPAHDTCHKTTISVTIEDQYDSKGTLFDDLNDCNGSINNHKVVKTCDNDGSPVSSKKIQVKSANLNEIC